MKTVAVYSKWRNKLIPTAEARANARVMRLRAGDHKLVKGKDGVPFRWDFFTQFFHEEMRNLINEYKSGAKA